MFEFLKAVALKIADWLMEVVEFLLNLFDGDGNGDPPELVEWAVCVHRNRAKVFKIASNESRVLGFAYPGEKYALYKDRVYNEGKKYGKVDLRPWHSVPPHKFIGHISGYIWLDDPDKRWRVD